MNSMVAGTMRCAMVADTVMAAARKSSNGTNRSICTLGRGSKRRMILVTMANVPSEPIRSWIRL